MNQQLVSTSTEIDISLKSKHLKRKQLTVRQLFYNGWLDAIEYIPLLGCHLGVIRVLIWERRNCPSLKGRDLSFNKLVSLAAMLH